MCRLSWDWKDELATVQVQSLGTPPPPPSPPPLAPPTGSSHRRFSLSAFVDVHEQVHVLDVGGRGRKAQPLVDVLGFRGNSVPLRLSEAGLQQGLDLFLTGPEAVLRRRGDTEEVRTPETREVWTRSPRGRGSSGDSPGHSGWSEPAAPPSSETRCIRPPAWSADPPAPPPCCWPPPWTEDWQ